jgi:hypothetical protein
MVVKIFKAVWFLSLLGILALFLIVYASLPERIIVREAESAVTLSREALFYISLFIFALCNVLVFVVSRLFSKGHDDFQCWFYGLIICLNIFFIISLNFINLYNSSEKFDYTRVGYIIYGSLWLVAGWAISWPFYSLFRKMLSKQNI